MQNYKLCDKYSYYLHINLYDIVSHILVQSKHTCDNCRIYYTWCVISTCNNISNISNSQPEGMCKKGPVLAGGSEGCVPLKRTVKGNQNRLRLLTFYVFPQLK